jgi:SAM-dependent methyltransferase
MTTTHYDKAYFVRQLSKSDAKISWHYNRVFALAGVMPTGRVLDVGCGAGPGLRYFAARGAQAFGVDLVYYPLVETRRLAPAADLAQGDVARNLPFADRSFDLLLLSELIEHIDRIEYWFYSKGGNERARIHKYVVFYLLRFLSGEVTDHDWEVNEARWFVIDEAIQALTFESERAVMMKAKKMIWEL